MRATFRAHQKTPVNCALTITAILALSSTACSGDGTGDDAEAAAPGTSSVPASDPTLDSDTAAGDGPTAADDAGSAGTGSDSIYGRNLDTLGNALMSGAGAESFTVDGTTLSLHFSEGSIEDPRAHTNCGAAIELLDEGHDVVLVYPDGEKDCRADDAASGAGSGDGGAGTATLTIEDQSWDFDQLACAFGEEETGVEGSEFNLSASSASASLYAAIDSDYTYVELADREPVDPALAELITGIEPTIEIDGKNIYANVSFATFEDPDTLYTGALTATCP